MPVSQVVAAEIIVQTERKIGDWATRVILESKDIGERMTRPYWRHFAKKTNIVPVKRNGKRIGIGQRRCDKDN